MIASYGLLRRELQSASSSSVYHAHWRAFDFGLLGLIVPAGMGIALMLTLGDSPVLSASLALGHHVHQPGGGGAVLLAGCHNPPAPARPVGERAQPVDVPLGGCQPAAAGAGFLCAGQRRRLLDPALCDVAGSPLDHGRHGLPPPVHRSWPGSSVAKPIGARVWLVGWPASFALVLPMLPMVASATGILTCRLLCQRARPGTAWGMTPRLA